jgi:tRNA(Ile)-lysidine synthase
MTGSLPPLPGAAMSSIERLLPRCSFPAVGTAVTCAVSGGADSTALAVLAVAAGCRVEIVHVDHGLRPGSARDAEVVAATAAWLGVPARSVRIALAPGPNLEARARAARYGVLPADVLTGHTADDQAETVLVNLLRGAAAAGLAGMRPGPRRPLLGLRRAETVELCAAAGLTVVDDETNRDLRFVRNQVRHRVLPMLAEVSGRDPVPVLGRQAELLRDDDDLLGELAGRLDVTDARALATAPRPLARRAVRAWLSIDDAERHPPDLATVDRVLEVAGGHRLACEVGGGRRVERHRQRLVLLRNSGCAEPAPPATGGASVG